MLCGWTFRSVWVLSFLAAALGSLALRSSAPGEGNSRGTVVVSRYDENIDWLSGLRKQDIKIEVLQSKNSQAPNFVPNVGNEAMKMLTYIADHYSSLPDSMIFVHAGNWDWHDPRPKAEILSSWNWSAAASRGGMKFLPTKSPCLLEDTNTSSTRRVVKGRWDQVQDDNEHSECLELEEHSMQQMAAVRDAWTTTFQAELGPLPARWITPCCAQFQVTRVAVRRHPQSFYKRIIDWVVAHDTALQNSKYGADMMRNHDPQRLDAGHLLEVIWVLLFRQH